MTEVLSVSRVALVERAVQAVLDLGYRCLFLSGGSSQLAVDVPVDNANLFIAEYVEQSCGFLVGPGDSCVICASVPLHGKLLQKGTARPCVSQVRSCSLPRWMWHNRALGVRVRVCARRTFHVCTAWMYPCWLHMLASYVGSYVGILAQTVV